MESSDFIMQLTNLQLTILDTMADSPESIEQITKGLNYSNIVISQTLLLNCIKDLLNKKLISIYYVEYDENQKVDYVHSWYQMTAKGKKYWNNWNPEQF